VPQDIGVSKRKLKIIQKSTSNKSKNWQIGLHQTKRLPQSKGNNRMKR
jgi:hypothetical protein